MDSHKVDTHLSARPNTFVIPLDGDSGKAIAMGGPFWNTRRQMLQVVEGILLATK